MPKEVQLMTAERLRDEFVRDLTTLATLFAQDVDRLDEAVRRHKIPRTYLEMNIKGAQVALRALQVFHRREFHEKLDDAIAGSYRWRVAERQAPKKKSKRKT